MERKLAVRVVPPEGEGPREAVYYSLPTQTAEGGRLYVVHTPEGISTKAGQRLCEDISSALEDQEVDGYVVLVVPPGHTFEVIEIVGREQVGG